mmetsp:Transcript_7492/g.11116  ORF Transcript_7492/g.11116 Transcript_7492/m.11116 type:complete len:421 (+) Transcript_7492:46-1308(+)
MRRSIIKTTRQTTRAFSTTLAQQKNKVYVVGVGMTKFTKPEGSGPYPDLVKEAGTQALEDARLSYTDIEQATAGYVYGDSTQGQRAMYSLGLTGIPIYNVNNNCSTGSTAIMLMKQLIEGGVVNCGMAVGFEKMKRGALSLDTNPTSNPLQPHIETMERATGEPFSKVPPTLQFFGNAGIEHMKKYGSQLEHFGKIAEKNHGHAKNNPKAQFQSGPNLETIMGSKLVFPPILTLLQCSPPAEGAGAMVLASEKFVKERGLEDRAIELASMHMVTDVEDSFKESAIDVVGTGLSNIAARKCYDELGIRPENIDLIELHDCFSTNELLTYEALELTEKGKGHTLVDSGDNTYGGKWVVNPSGGLIAKSHPLGATGLAQANEITQQLRGEAGARQVENASIGLQHNIGLGSACIVGVYKKPDF